MTVDDPILDPLFDFYMAGNEDSGLAKLLRELADTPPKPTKTELLMRKIAKQAAQEMFIFSQMRRHAA